MPEAQPITEPSSPMLHAAEKMYDAADKIMDKAEVEKLNKMADANSPDGVPAGLAAHPSTAEVEQQRANLEQLYKEREHTALLMQAHPKPSIVAPIVQGTIASGVVLTAANEFGNKNKLLDKMIKTAGESIKETAGRDANGNIAADAVAKVTEAVKHLLPEKVSDEVLHKITEFAVDIKAMPSGLKEKLGNILTAHNVQGIDIDKLAKSTQAYVEKTAGKPKLDLSKSKDLAKALGVDVDVVNKIAPDAREAIVKEISNATGWLHDAQNGLANSESQVIHAVQEKVTSGKVGNVMHTIAETVEKGPLPKSANITLAVLATVGAAIGIHHLLSSGERKEHEKSEKKMSFLAKEIEKTRKGIESTAAGVGV